MSTSNGESGGGRREWFGRWARRVWDGDPEAPPLERSAGRATWILLGVTTIVMAVGFARGSDRLLSATLWAYNAAGLFFLVFVISIGRRVRRRWAEASQPAFDLAGALQEPDVIVRRRSRASRAGFMGLGAIFVGVAIKFAFELSSPLLVRVISAGFFVAFGAFTASFGGSMLVVTRAVIAARTNVQWRTASWEEVAAIEPTHDGLAFELLDGRRLTAAVTAKNGLAFLKPRYDSALLETLRARLS